MITCNLQSLDSYEYLFAFLIMMPVHHYLILFDSITRFLASGGNIYLNDGSVCPKHIPQLRATPQRPAATQCPDRQRPNATSGSTPTHDSTSTSSNNTGWGKKHFLTKTARRQKALLRGAYHGIGHRYNMTVWQHAWIGKEIDIKSSLLAY